TQSAREGAWVVPLDPGVEPAVADHDPGEPDPPLAGGDRTHLLCRSLALPVERREQDGDAVQPVGGVVGLGVDAEHRSVVEELVTNGFPEWHGSDPGAAWRSDLDVEAVLRWVPDLHLVLGVVGDALAADAPGELDR